MKKFLLLTAALAAMAGCTNQPSEPDASSTESAAATPVSDRPNVTINVNQSPQTLPTATAPAPIPQPAPATPPTETTPVATPPAATASPKADVGQRLRQERVTYLCDNEEMVELRVFPAQGVATLWRGGQPTELHQVKAYPPKFRYEAGPVASVEGTPESFTMQVGAMALTRCMVKK